ncbi:hypothetical protein C5B73_20300 [Nocardia cyriacigeorgica]|nr:hypothetical protein C5B73_20300 [Nocardia cyriacigeorgica]
MLTAMIDHLADYPGIAAWLLRNGPQTERLVPVLDAGISRMLDAGWGEEAATACSIAFNTCLGLIALDDQRARDPDGGGPPGLHQQLQTHPDAGVGAEQMRRMVAEFSAADDAERVRVRRDYGRYALDRLLDGEPPAVTGKLRNRSPVASRSFPDRSGAQSGMQPCGDDRSAHITRRQQP